MKRSFSFLLFTLCCVVAFSQGKEKVERFNEPYRPQYHFTPQENRMGAPISLIQIDSTYHMFYQWNPDNLQQGFVNWGYAVSYDLLRWKHMGIAISQPSTISDSMLQTPWWGSVVSNDNQSFSWVNSWGDGIFRYSEFSNGKWGKSEKVKGIDDFTKAEPYVFWHQKSNKWGMLAFNHSDSTMNLLNSGNGIDWNKISSFNIKHSFPSLIEMPVDSNYNDKKWLLTTESGNYIIGSFDGEKFDVNSPLNKFDYGRFIGGSFIFNDKKNSRFLMLAELKSDQQADLPSNGMFTFPTELSLHKTEAGIELIRKPAAEINKLHGKSYIWDNKKIYPGINNNLLQGLKGDCYHLKGTIDLKNCDVVGILIRTNKENNGIDLAYNVPRGIMEIEGNRINYKPKNNKIEWEILIDRSSVEVFVDGGRYVISTTMAPEPKNLRYLLYTTGGEIMVEHFEAHELKSVWREEK